MRFDVVVIGSGFGGSVAALRLAEKGYAVAVLEAGRRFADDEFPATSWDARRFLWAPALRCFGIQRMTLLRHVLALSGAGVGGGSLVYGNTMYRPSPRFYADPQWHSIAEWEAELAPYYDRAERMLGVTTYARTTRADAAMRVVAGKLGAAGTYRPAPVAVYFGPSGVDPYFGGAGPLRQRCIECGACLTGCRTGAKNTLVKNYLYLAEHLGVEVRPRTTVTAVRPYGNGYLVETRRTGGRARDRIEAGQVVFAAGALGTTRLLLRMQGEGTLPRLSSRVGALVRTNSGSILAARARGRDADFTEGVSITGSFHPDADTHVQPVRYGRGSGAMGLLQTVLADGGAVRPVRWLGVLVRHPLQAARVFWLRRWAEQTIVVLVMHSVDNSLQLLWRRAWYGRRRLSTRQGHGGPSLAWLPAGNRVARLLADEIGGDAGGSLTEPLNIPVTAHLLGGAPIGADVTSGVVDGYHRVFGHEGLHVLDGAAVSANLGVNPALTITAQAERALAMWPNRGERDARPALGTPYVPVAAVAPNRPAVPAEAPAAL